MWFSFFRNLAKKENKVNPSLVPGLSLDFNPHKENVCVSSCYLSAFGTAKGNYSVLTLNVRSSRNQLKRRNIFNYLKDQNCQFYCLQEIYSKPNDERIWRSEWGGDIFLSHGTTHGKGVCILVNPSLRLSSSIENFSGLHYVSQTLFWLVTQHFLFLQCRKRLGSIHTKASNAPDHKAIKLSLQLSEERRGLGL